MKKIQYLKPEMVMCQVDVQPMLAESDTLPVVESEEINDPDEELSKRKSYNVWDDEEEEEEEDY